MWTLCFNEECFSILNSLALPDVVLLRLPQLELHDAELLQAKGTRSEIEYFLTCRAALMAWLLENHPEIDMLTYADGDLFFFDSPDVVFDEFKNFSTMIVPHNFSQRNSFAVPLGGIYNVGWIAFRRDADGLACLQWWRRCCIEWCYDILEEDRWLEQKYLDQFPKRFARVKIVEHPGINLAPWNIDRYVLSAGPNNQPLIDGRPVIFFHFSAMRRVSLFLWNTNHLHWRSPLTRDVRRLLYAPYFKELIATERLVRQRFPSLPTPHQWKGSRIIGSGLYPLLREIARIAVRGGGIWLFGSTVL